jgi:hypothetical protein
MTEKEIAKLRALYEAGTEGQCGVCLDYGYDDSCGYCDGDQKTKLTTLSQAAVNNLLPLIEENIKLKAENERLTARYDSLRKTVSDLVCDGCEYGDDCPPNARHYTCRSCHLQRELDKEQG